MTSSLLAPLVILVYIVTVGCFYMFWAGAVRRLRDHHPEEWERLGRPGIVRNNTISNGTPLLLFLLGRGHKRLNDDDLNITAVGFRVTFCLMNAFLVTIALFILANQ